MSRKLFVAGCIVLLALGIVHLGGHYAMATNQGQTDHERELLALMRSNPQDLGLGMVRTMSDIVLGFSLTFSVLPFGMGLAGLVVLRHAKAAPALLRHAAIVYAGSYGVMTAIALRYWFVAPLTFLAAAFVCFAGAVATSDRGTP